MQIKYTRETTIVANCTVYHAQLMNDSATRHVIVHWGSPFSRSIDTSIWRGNPHLPLNNKCVTVLPSQQPPDTQQHCTELH